MPKLDMIGGCSSCSSASPLIARELTSVRSTNGELPEYKVACVSQAQVACLA